MGELTDRSRAAIPIVGCARRSGRTRAAVPRCQPLRRRRPQAWGVVISTDTAFLLGALAVVGPKKAARLRIFLLTLAVADDVGALAIIAFFYTDDLDVVPLVLAFVGSRLIFLLRRLEVWRGVAVLRRRAVHVGRDVRVGRSPHARRRDDRADSSGVPAAAPRGGTGGSDLTRAFRQSPNPEYARAAQLGLDRAVSVNERLMRLYQPYTAFIIVPIFALANAGVVPQRGHPEGRARRRRSPGASCRPGARQARRNHRGLGHCREVAALGSGSRADDVAHRGRCGDVRNRVHDLAVHHRSRARRSAAGRRGPRRRAGGLGHRCPARLGSVPRRREDPPAESRSRRCAFCVRSAPSAITSAGPSTLR